MKKLAFLLAAVMLLGFVFSVVPFAEGETQTPAGDPAYKSVEIAYANLNYTDKIEMMFAVPVYEDLPEGAEIKLIAWDSYDPNYAYNYSDVELTATLISANADKANIDGKDHLVFVYDSLSAEMMTDVIYVRPVIILADGSRIYGDIMTYSIIEYVKSAKGEIDGIAGINNPSVIEALDKMLNFGAMAQIMSSDEYIPNGFLANEELNKVYIIPVVAGVEGERVFAGFCKAGADFASINPIPEDLYVVGGIYDLDGELLTDDDEDFSGIQVDAPAEGDLVVKCVYDYDYMYKSTLNDVNIDASKIYGDSAIDGNAKGVNITDGNLRTNTGSNNPSKGQYVSYQVIPDPNGTDNKVLRISTTGGGALYFGYSSGSKTVTSGNKSEFSGNTFTMTMELSAYNGKFRGLGSIRMRAKEGGGLAKYDQNVLNIGANGEIKYNFNGTSEAIYTLSTEGWNKIAIAVDMDEMIIRFYAEENGAMVCKDEREFVPSKYNNVLKSGTPDETSDTFAKSFMNYQRNVEWYFGGADGLSAAELASSMDMDGDGVAETPIKVTNAETDVLNIAAQQQYIIENKSVLVKEISFASGDIYAE